ARRRRAHVSPGRILPRRWPRHGRHNARPGAPRVGPWRPSCHPRRPEFAQYVSAGHTVCEGKYSERRALTHLTPMSGSLQWHAPERTSRSGMRSGLQTGIRGVQMHGSATRREALSLGVRVIGLLTLASCQRSQTTTADAIEAVKLPAELPVERFDFETKGIEGWTTVEGRWVVEEMAGARRGEQVLVQRATENQFNVI